MQKSESNQTLKSARRQVQASTTLNRKYVRRPSAMSSSGSKDADFSVAVKTNDQSSGSKISRFGSETVKQSSKDSQSIEPAVIHPTQAIANQKMRERKQRTVAEQRPTAKELKDQAIQKALASAARQQPDEEQQNEKKLHFGFGRVLLALTCAAAAIFAIVYFVNLNMPDIQFRAAAMQLNASYPNYLPYNYSPVGIASENKIITLSFENHVSDESFIITEEKLSWDSNSLLNNFVKEEYGEDYTIVREQGLTIYIGNGKAAWVNGGIVYKLSVQKGSLSKKQISAIAVSF